MVIIAAAYVLTQPGKDSGGPSEDRKVVDSLGSEVPVPSDLDDGIVTVGWNVLKVLWMMLFSYNGEMVQYHGELVRILWIYIPFMVFYGMISFGSSLLGALEKSQVSAATYSSARRSS